MGGVEKIADGVWVQANMRTSEVKRIAVVDGVWVQANMPNSKVKEMAVKKTKHYLWEIMRVHVTHASA